MDRYRFETRHAGKALIFFKSALAYEPGRKNFVLPQIKNKISNYHYFFRIPSDYANLLPLPNLNYLYFGFLKLSGCLLFEFKSRKGKFKFYQTNFLQGPFSRLGDGHR